MSLTRSPILGSPGVGQKVRPLWRTSRCVSVRGFEEKFVTDSLKGRVVDSIKDMA